MKTATLRSFFAVLLLLGPYCTCCNAFSVVSHHDGTRRGLFISRTTLQSSTDNIQDNDNDNDKKSVAAVAAVYDCTLPPELSEVERLKRQLLELGASYDRGFGASPRARDKAESIITQLEQLNPEKQAARGIDGSTSIDIDNNNDDSAATAVVPLKGSWRMIWTTASDVLLLNASPAFSVGAIHQVFEPPIVTNVIDFSPRAQALFPPNLVPNTLLRAKVKTKSSSRRSKNKNNSDDDGGVLPNRVGLVFEAVQLQPLQVLGMDIDVFPQIGFDLPKFPIPDSLLPPGLQLDGPDSPGYFDVVFLDYEVLVIRQNAPGGVFCFCKVDSIDA